MKIRALCRAALLAPHLCAINDAASWDRMAHHENYCVKKNSGILFSSVSGFKGASCLGRADVSSKVEAGDERENTLAPR
jgi:hypothetical protein